jgi:hypothetical protein
VTRVTLGSSMCQPLVCARLAKVVGEVTGTPGVWEFGTPKDLGCSIVERPKGSKAGATRRYFGTPDSKGKARRKEKRCSTSK